MNQPHRPAPTIPPPRPSRTRRRCVHWSPPPTTTTSNNTWFGNLYAKSCVSYWGQKKKKNTRTLFLFMLLFSLFIVNVYFAFKYGSPFHYYHRILFKFNILLYLKAFLLFTLNEWNLQFEVGCLFPMSLKFEMLQNVWIELSVKWSVCHWGEWSNTWEVKEKLEVFIWTDFAQSFFPDAFLYS